ncbi:MAG: hypothetical protein LBJ44_10270 [Propionibacteriaceae bacterium]|jgi:uncharacterized protein with PQ loop repeat|nr:hypothetical protein [Propionibacteriaceae bacterium]
MGLTVLGWLAAASSAAVALPQLVHLWRDHRSGGVSLLLWQLTMCTSIGWTMHGFRDAQANIVVPNALGTVIAGLVLGAILSDRDLDWRRVYPPAVLAGFAVGATDWLVSAVVFGLIMLVPALVGQISQGRGLVGHPDIRGVSAGYLAVNLLVQALWFAWSVGAQDGSIMWCAALTGLAIVVNLVLYATRALGWRRSEASEETSAETAAP